MLFCKQSTWIVDKLNLLFRFFRYSGVSNSDPHWLLKIDSAKFTILINKI